MKIKTFSFFTNDLFKTLFSFFCLGYFESSLIYFTGTPVLGWHFLPSIINIGLIYFLFFCIPILILYFFIKTTNIISIKTLITLILFLQFYWLFVRYLHKFIKASSWYSSILHFEVYLISIILIFVILILIIILKYKPNIILYLNKYWIHLQLIFLLVFPILLSGNILLKEHSELHISQKLKLSSKPNIFWFVWDTVRADHTSVYGYLRKTTPFLEKFSKDSVVYENTFSSSSWTLPSTASMITGLFPSIHGAIYSNVLPRNSLSFAKFLKQLGYKTSGVAGLGYVSSAYNFDEGFDKYHSSSSNRLWMLTVLDNFMQRSGLSSYIPLNMLFIVPLYHRNTISSDDAIYLMSLLEEDLKYSLSSTSSGPAFFYYHLSGAHSPYTPPEKYNVFNDTPPLPPQTLLSKLSPDTLIELRESINCYDGEIYYHDAVLSDFIKLLKRYNIYDSSFIIVTSDHGEEFYEHGEMGHRRTLYKEVINVPLLIKFPNQQFGGTRIKSAVSNIQIFPTILSYLNISPKPFNFSVSPLPLSNFRKDDYFTIFSEKHFRLSYSSFGDIYSIIKYPYQYIETYSKYNGILLSEELFNISNDPYETNNLSDKYYIKKNLLKSKLIKKLNYLDKKKIISHKNIISNTTKENLKSLGYIN